MVIIRTLASSSGHELDRHSKQMRRTTCLTLVGLAESGSALCTAVLESG